MIKLARRSAPGARFRTGPFTTLPLPTCQAITAIGGESPHRRILTRQMTTFRRVGRLYHRREETRRRRLYRPAEVAGDRPAGGPAAPASAQPPSVMATAAKR